MDKAARLASPQADFRDQLGALYLQLELFDKAVEQYDLWVAAHPGDGTLSDVLAHRCRARTLSGQKLDEALADCNRAVRLGPRTAETLDTRGLTNLRLGQYDLAIADCIEALKISPNFVWSLYGRGLAEDRMGMKVEGQADMSRTPAIAPYLAQAVRRLGVSPS